MTTLADVTEEAPAVNSESIEDKEEELESLRCWDCNINFTDQTYLNNHLLYHIKQPQVSLKRLQIPLKITISQTNNSFVILNSPTSFNLAESEQDEQNETIQAEKTDDTADQEIEENVVPNFAEVTLPSHESIEETSKEDGGESSDCGSIPGAEPTPPPEPSPDYPKIRIKTMGLLKEPLTITEVTDDDADGTSDVPPKKSEWADPLQDPLKLPGTDDILSLFNNNERAKDFGFTTSDSEFMPLDRLDENNRNAMQLYNSGQINHNAISSLTGLPMQALAQQVSRLQPSGNGMHQQNVLINIQQFPQPAPHPPPYQPPPHMYHHPQPVYHPPPYPSYPPPPPNPMFYPPSSGYPPHMPPPPQPQLPPMVQPPISQPQPMQQSAPFRTMPIRQQNPRPMPPQRMPTAPRQPVGNQRQPVPRQRAPMVRPRGIGMTAVRSLRPRLPVSQNGQVRPSIQIKRSTGDVPQLQLKKKRLDVLTPDKDDEDCQVICIQPKNTDGGLPQIESVQGGTTEPAESNVMHLSDSITLSVRNPQPRAESPKRSDAKAVANILATRGITVTATPKAKEKEAVKANNAAPPTQPLNLNSAVSIIPSAGKTPPQKTSSSSPEPQLPTVDLTEDASPAKSNNSQKAGQRNQTLPYKCDLCPAQYPNAIGLSKHRQNYHKTNSGMCEIGIPLVNLKQPGIFQKLSSLGIYNYIPLPAAGPEGLFGLPIINGRSPGNVAALGTTQILTLGPVRSIPRTQNAVNGQVTKPAQSPK